MWYIYMIELSNGAYYTGITNDVHKRMKVHREGKGSKCVRSFLPFSLVYLEESEDRSAATKREIQIKKLTKFQKLVYILLDENLAWENEWRMYMAEDKKCCGGGGDKKCCEQDKKTKDCDKDDCDCDKKDCKEKE